MGTRIGKFGFIVLVGALLSLTMFLSLNYFVDNKITPKWYAFIILASLGSIIFIFGNVKTIIIDKGSLILLILIGYFTFRGVLSSMPHIDISIFLSFILLYLLFQSDIMKTIPFAYLLVIITALQAVLALLQNSMVFPTNDTFGVLGSYSNPAGLATNLACVFPIIFVFLRKHRILSCLFILIILYTIVLSESRAGILSIFIVSGIYFYNNLPHSIRRYQSHILGVSIIFIIIFFVYLFFLKQNSAIGRILIWKVTASMIADNISFGGGSYSFYKNYMLHQADYFVENPESRYALLAGNIMYSFNEYLLLIVRYGVFSFFIIKFGLIVILQKTRWSSPYLLCILAIGIISMFSYPFHFPITWVVLIYCLAQINRMTPLFSVSRTWSKMIVSILFFVVYYFFINDIKFEYKWNKVAKTSLMGQTGDMQSNYEELYHNWNGNHLFLYNYAAELHHIGDNLKSLNLLDITINYWNDYDIQMLYADNYRQLEEWFNSEKHLTTAAYMCPNRFLPLFYLHEVYVKTNRPEKALIIAKNIVNKEVKIQSSTIIFIKTQMKNYIIKQGGTSQQTF